MRIGPYTQRSGSDAESGEPAGQYLHARASGRYRQAARARIHFAKSRNSRKKTDRDLKNGRLSGRISLKPSEAMDEMKFDMCGAATVLGTLHAIAEAGLKLNVMGVIPSCENLPGGV